MAGSNNSSSPPRADPMTDFAALLQPDKGQPARTLHLVHPDRWSDWLAGQPPRVRAIAAANGLTGKAGNAAILPGDAADDWSALLVCDEPGSSPWRIASRATALPAGTYRLAEGEPGAAALGWLLAQHRFTRYRKAEGDTGARVPLTGTPEGNAEPLRRAEATALVRDLVDTGASDLGPAEIETEVAALAKAHGATLAVTRGDALAQGYPMIHAVGQAAAKGREPRLVELEWGRPEHPRVAIVGKGVVFDSGG